MCVDLSSTSDCVLIFSIFLEHGGSLVLMGALGETFYLLDNQVTPDTINKMMLTTLAMMIKNSLHPGLPGSVVKQGTA